MTDYNKLKVLELKDLCAKRNLPTTGVKKDLLARLVESDAAAAASATSTTTSASAAGTKTTATAHLPSAEEYEINWDEDDTGGAAAKPAAAAATATPATQPSAKKAVVAASGTANGADKKSAAEAPEPTTVGSGPGTDTTGKKPFVFKKLSDQFPDLPSVAKDDKKKDSKPATATSSKPSTPAAAAASSTTPTTTTAATTETSAATTTTTTADAAPAEPEPKFAANLPPSTLTSELERRKARATRFGAENMDAASKEALKKLERAQRFGDAAGAGAGDGAASTAETPAEVKGLDSALPERRARGNKRGYEGPSGGRGGVSKKQRYTNVGRRGGERRAGGGGGGGGGASSGAGGKQSAKSVLDMDPAEKERAEKRKARFGA